MVKGASFLIFLAISSMMWARDSDRNSKQLPTADTEANIDGAKQIYSVSLHAGEFLHIKLDKEGVNVVLELRNPSGKILVTQNNPNGAEGLEYLSWIATESGPHSLTISCFDSASCKGSYIIGSSRTLIATHLNRRTVEIENLYRHTLQLFNSTDEHSQTLGYGQLSNRLNDWEELRDSYMTGLINRLIQAHIRLQPKPSLAGPAQGYSSQNRFNGYPIRVPIKYGERLQLKVHVKAGEALRVEVDEHNAYVSLAIGRETEPNQVQVLVQSHYGAGIGRETATYIPKEDGEYWIVVEPEPEYQVGKDAWFDLIPYIAPTVTSSDRDRMAAETLLFQAYLYRHKETTADPTKELPVLINARQLWHAIGDTYWEAFCDERLGQLYSDSQSFDESLEADASALRLFQENSSLAEAAGVARELAETYSYLGDMDATGSYMREARDLWKQTGNNKAEASVLAQYCGYSVLFEDEKEQDSCFNEALGLVHDEEDRFEEAIVSNDYGLFLMSNGHPQQALLAFKQSLSRAGDQADDDFVLVVNTNIANAELQAGGGRTNLLDDLFGMLGMAMLRNDPSLEAGIFRSLSAVASKNNETSLAIFYAKESVDIYQRQRSEIGKLSEREQKTFLLSSGQSYRFLADLLIQSHRPREAQEVLNQFKNEQLFDFRAVEDSPALLHPISMTSAEEASASQLNEQESRIKDLGKRYLALGVESRQISKELQLSPDEQAEYERVSASTKASLASHLSLEHSLEEQFHSNPAESAQESSDTQTLQEHIRTMEKATGHPVVAIYTLLNGDNLEEIVVTKDDIQAVKSSIDGEQLSELIIQYWSLLQSDLYDPIMMASKLYDSIVKPIERMLPIEGSTILWSLDRNLRYIPPAALFDGRRYLVERYNNVLFTRDDLLNDASSLGAQSRGIGFGSSDAHAIEQDGRTIEFDALPGVLPELRSIFKVPGNSEGIVQGEIFSNKKFTKENLVSALSSRKPIVHLASHFSFEPGNETRSFLLLGDGNTISMEEMESHSGLFDGVELLTLSACDTAAQRPDATGTEIDGFAELAQRLGAHAVLATLWAAADDSTPTFMKEFYGLLLSSGHIPRAEALRRAQLSLLKGQIKGVAQHSNRGHNLVMVVPSVGKTKKRGGSNDSEVLISESDAPRFKASSNRPFAHPFYWAPFVLFGEWM